MEVGITLAVVDGVAKVLGVDLAFIGELLTIGTIKAMALNIENSVSALTVIGNDRDVLQGDIVERSFAELLIKVGFFIVGRVIDPIANFLDA